MTDNERLKDFVEKTENADIIPEINLVILVLAKESLARREKSVGIDQDRFASTTQHDEVMRVPIKEHNPEDLVWQNPQIDIIDYTWVKAKINIYRNRILDHFGNKISDALAREYMEKEFDMLLNEITRKENQKHV